VSFVQGDIFVADVNVFVDLRQVKKIMIDIRRLIPKTDKIMAVFVILTMIVHAGLLLLF